MNIVNKLTIRQMLKNKRQTLVTIIGVIISVAMVSAVAILATSFMNLMQKQVIAENGDWHVRYENVNEEQLQTIQTDKETKASFLSRDVGYAQLEDSENPDKPYVFLKQFDDRGLEEYPINLLEGRMPENDREVLVAEHVDSNADVTYTIGDELTLEIGKRTVNAETAEEQAMPDDVVIDQEYALITDEEGEMEEYIDVEATETFTVVGVMDRPHWEPSWSPGYTMISYVDPTTVASDNPVDVSVTQKKVNSNIYDYTKTFAKDSNIESYEMHSELLQFHGVFRNAEIFGALFVFVGIIMVIIMIGSISLIYNAFAISVSERSRQLGMLSSVGATKRQKRNAVLFEGTVIGLISIPIGFLSGIAGLAITFHFVNDSLMNVFSFNEPLELTVTPFTIILTAVVSILTIFISTYIPARRASKISAIDAIRQTKDITLTGKRVKTSKLARKLFGFEAEIGLKNLKRNKKRYVATVFSLFISIVLFLSVAYFTQTLQRTLTLTQEGYNADIEVWYSSESISDQDQQIIDQMKQLPDVTESNLLRSLNLSMYVDQSYIPDHLIEEGASRFEEKVSYSIDIHLLEDQVLKEYAKEMDIDEKTLHSTDEINGMIIDTMSMIDPKTSVFKEERTFLGDVGDKVELMTHDYETDEVVNSGELTVVGMTDEVPMGILSKRAYAGIDILLSKEAYEQLDYSDEWGEGQNRLYMSSSDPMKTGEELKEIKASNMHIYNYEEEKQKEEQLNFVMSVFVYGFVVLITLISVANIFNTISTSIAMRKREFGMLKSVGMTPKGFRKMIRYESIFYGLKALLYGLPISIGLMYLMHLALSEGFQFPFSPPWMHIGIVIIAVFLIVSVSMMYSSAKIKKENIIDALKQENI